MDALGQLPPNMVAPLPAPRSAAYVERLARSECPALTARRARRAEASGAAHDPIVWARARDCNVMDVDGNRYVDLTAGFGVAAVGHAHPEVVEAVQRQSARLMHALGDAHPSDVKVELLEALQAHAPFTPSRVMLGLNGSDAVEAALKTAMLATGKPGVIAFTGGYHGLSHGPLAACGYRDAFRTPFSAQLNPHVAFAPYPSSDASPDDAVNEVERVWRSTSTVGAVLVEPMLGRGGVRAAPEGFLAALQRWCRERALLLIVDEIFTGLGRCGRRWLCDTEDVQPDLLCTGKALGGGMPVSACLGRSEVMQAWGEPAGEALHTATFLGHPVGCAAALATLRIVERDGLARRARELGEAWCHSLQRAVAGRPLAHEVRGRGLMIGVQLDAGARTLAVVRHLLERGYLTLPAGPDGSVLSLTPPLTCSPTLMEGFNEALAQALDDVS